MLRPPAARRLGPIHRRLAPMAILVATLLLPVASVAPVAAATTPVNAITSATVASLVTYVAGLAARLTSAERARIPTLARELAALKTDAARAQRNHDEQLAASVKARLHRLSLAITDLPPVARQDEIGVRTEPEMGKPECREQDTAAAYCTADAWLTTRSRNFVNIRKHAFVDAGLELPQGVRVNASFVAENDNTVVAALFSAETFVDDDVAGSNRRLFVRALIDGTPAKPGDVVFATTDHHGLRQFLFTATVRAGIHTVEIQWMVDAGATAAIRDANLLVRTGRSLPSDLGTLTAATPASGPNLVKATAVWADVAGTSLWFWVPSNGVVTVTFTAEANVSNDKAIAARALIDNAVILPSDVVFARGSTFQSRGFTFGKLGLTEGWHSARVQWFVEQGGTGQLGDRSIAVAAYPSSTGQPSHPFIVAPSGPNYVLPVNGPQAIPGMTTPVNIPAKGNGEVAVIFSAEVVSTTEAAVMLDVDGLLHLDTLATMSDGTIPGQIKSYVLEAKRLTPGPHTLTVFISGTAGLTQLGDRTMAVMSETGYVPDLAESPRLAGGRILEKNIGGIEPLVGPRKVLTILFDAEDCTAFPSPTCVDGDDVTPAEVAQALYGPGDSVNDYFQNNSGGRFSITNAGVVGWYPAGHPHSYYWDKNWDSCAFNASGFSSGHAARVAEAVQAANPDVNFASYDTNGDGEIDNHELAIVVVFPQNNPDGSSLAELLAAQCPGDQRLSFDNVMLPRYVSGVFTSLDDTFEVDQWTTFAHELMHQWSLLDDIYISGDHATFPGALTLMSRNRFTTTHLDPIQKLALGWVTPRLVDDDLQTALTRVEESNRVLVLPRYGAPDLGEEYYVIENRDNDAGPGRYDDAIGDSGIAVWHAISDKSDAAKHSIGTTQAYWDTTAASVAAPDPPGDGTMGRWGVRLLRPWDNLTNGGVAMFSNASNTLWDNTTYTLVSGVCPVVFPGPPFVIRNRLAWADCTASGYGIQFMSAPGNSMTVKITKV